MRKWRETYRKDGENVTLENQRTIFFWSFKVVLTFICVFVHFGLKLLTMVKKYKGIKTNKQTYKKRKILIKQQLHLTLWVFGVKLTKFCHKDYKMTIDCKRDLDLESVMSPIANGLLPAPAKWSQFSWHFLGIQRPPYWSQMTLESSDWSELLTV